MAKWRVLAIDDDPDILELIEMTLSERFDVLTVDSSVHALETVEIFQPDLVILDIMMPKVTGYQIIEELKKRRETNHMPVIFLSAKDTIRDQKYGYKLGATTYLTKPFQPARLVRNVLNIFDHTPPDRQPKKFTAQQAKERIRALRLGQVMEKSQESKAMPTTGRTVHHREEEDEMGEPQWQG